MLGSAVQRLLHLYAVAPGRKAIAVRVPAVKTNEDGYPALHEEPCELCGTHTVHLKSVCEDCEEGSK